MLTEAYLRAGRYDEATRILRQRLERRPSPRDHYWLGRAHAGSGDRESAAAGLRAAEAAWARADVDSAELAAVRSALTALAV